MYSVSDEVVTEFNNYMNSRMCLLYENKMTVNIRYNYFGDGMHAIESTDGININFEDDILSPFLESVYA